ncbi:MAG TPA: arginyltransferase [Desulfomonilia bacterium]
MKEDRKCPYLPGRNSLYEEYYVDHLEPHIYEKLLSMGFRRSGRIVYRPICRNCSECRQIRIPVGLFNPGKSMKRVSRLGADVQASISRPRYSDEKHELFKRYLNHYHDNTMSRDRMSFISFLYDSPAETYEIVYSLEGRTVGISIVDAVPDGLSSVYMYFDPEYGKLSPGTLSIIREIRLCLELKLPYYYLGYLVSGSKTMNYKSRFRPYEVLTGPGKWETAGEKETVVFL